MDTLKLIFLAAVMLVIGGIALLVVFAGLGPDEDEQ